MNAKLYQADAVELMRSIPDRSVHAVCADPPYCAGGFTASSRTAGSYGGKLGISADNLQPEGFEELIRLVAVQSRRVLVPGGWLLLFSDWRMIPQVARAAESAGLNVITVKFMGSGSTGVAAVGMRRSFIGSDLDEHHVATATERIGAICAVEGNTNSPIPQPGLFAEVAS